MGGKKRDDHGWIRSIGVKACGVVGFVVCLPVVPFVLRLQKVCVSCSKQARITEPPLGLGYWKAGGVWGNGVPRRRLGD